jgi:hypothetical protein
MFGTWKWFHGRLMFEFWNRETGKRERALFADHDNDLPFLLVGQKKVAPKMNSRSARFLVLAHALAHMGLNPY